MRIGLGTVLLLAATSLVGLTQSPVAAATGCGAPDTTWLGPATEGGSTSWDEPTNWSGGVPTATSAVCIPYTDGTGPHVLEGTQAQAQVVTLEGTLTVEATLDVATLEGDDGELHGPGTATVASGITGSGLKFVDNAVIELPGSAVLGGELNVWDGSRLNVRGDALLEDGASIESFAEGPGYFTVADTGTLTLDSANGSAEVYGGFANHGEVHVLAGWLTMLGAGDEAPPGQFSDGSFTASPEATLTLAYTELRTGARVDHAAWVDHLTVPADNTATVSDSSMAWDPFEPEPNLAGAGELVVTHDSIVGGRISGSLTVTVPAGDVAAIDDAIVEDRVRIRVDGELAQSGSIFLEGDAVLDVYGTHRAVDGGGAGYGGGFVEFEPDADPGAEIIHQGGRLLCDEGSVLGIYSQVVNHGTVDSGSGLIVIAPLVAGPEPSSGTFHAGSAGDLYLGDAGASTPELALDHATIEGPVQVAGPVRGSDLQVRGQLETRPLTETQPGGELVLAGTTELANGASVAGDATVGGQLVADLGPTGTASLSGADVTGDVVAISGTLSVPNLAPTTLGDDGTLHQGQWHVWEGATLDLPAVTNIDAELVLFGPGASFGDGLANLTDIGPNGTLLLDGDGLTVPGPFRNAGILGLFAGSRLDVGGKFRQFATGRLWTEVNATGLGKVRAAGPRDLAGELQVGRDPAYTPPVGSVLSFISSDGRKGADDAFDKVVSPKYGTRKIRVDYGIDKVRLRVDRVG